MKAFPRKTLTKLDCLDRLTARAGLSLRAALNNNEPDFFGTYLGLPYWFEDVTNYLYKNASSFEWVDAIEPGVNVDKIRTSFLIFVQKQNVKNLLQRTEKNSMSHNLILLIFELLVVRFDCEKVKSLITCSTTLKKVAQKIRLENESNRREMLARLSAGLIEKSVPYNQQDNMRSAIESIRDTSQCVINSMTLAEVDQALARTHLIKLLRELKK